MKVVIVGGGFCGSILAKKMDREDQFKTLLIDDDGRYEYYPSLPKLLSEPSLKEKITLDHSSFLPGIEIIKEGVKKITSESVKTENRSIDFDRLVLCFGADYPIRLENENNVHKVTSIRSVYQARKALVDSDHILIIGGGLIGVEIAAEIAEELNKNITLVHPHERLLERNPIEASEYAERFLKDRGVNILFDDKVVENHGAFMTEKGKEIDSDMAIWAAGLSFHGSLLSGFGDDVFSDKWGLKVDDTLKLKGHDDIYVGGDITSLDEEKTGHNADVHGKRIYKNLKRESRGKEPKKYTKRNAPMVISLGRKDGIMVFEGKILTGGFPAAVKKLLEIGAVQRLRF